MSIDLIFKIFNWVIYSINAAALLFFFWTVEWESDEPIGSSFLTPIAKILPYSTWQISIMMFVTLATPYINLIFIPRSLKILREPAKKLWKKIRAKVSIWRD